MNTTDGHLIFSIRLQREQIAKIDQFAELDGRPSRNNAIQHLINIGLANTPVTEGRHDKP